MNEQPERSKWMGKTPRTARDICDAIQQSGKVIENRQQGSHRTFEIRGNGNVVENLTVVVHRPGQDLRDTNPKAWRRLTKRMKELGIIALLATGGYAAATHLPQVMRAVEVAQHTLK